MFDDTGLGAAMEASSLRDRIKKQEDAVKNDLRVNALGQPAPNRTDFTLWSRENLEAFARQAADENLVLRADNKALHEAWRQAVKAGLSQPHV
jgi:hypothetical protein